MAEERETENRHSSSPLNKFHGLHPLKRFKLQQQQQREAEAEAPPPPSTKPRHLPFTTSYCLPAKKRIWALCHPPTPPSHSSPSPPQINPKSSPSPRKNPTPTKPLSPVPPKRRRTLVPRKLIPQLDNSLATPLETLIPNNPPKSFSSSLETLIPSSAENPPNFVDSPISAKPQEPCTSPVSAKSLNFQIHGKPQLPSPCKTLTPRKPTSSTAEGVSDSEHIDDGIICSICGSTDGDPSDPIVFCDGCDLMVHALCYGRPLIDAIPETSWFCAKCERHQSKTEVLSCCLCPVKGGALKETDDGKWAHILCAVLVPEVFFEDPEGREGIVCSRVPIGRWTKECYVCKSVCGAAVECSQPKCSLGFHVACGLEKDLHLEYREEKELGVVVSFCEEHTQMWKKQQLTGKFKIVPREKRKRRNKGCRD